MVDDDATVREVVVNYLRAAGMDTLIAEDGEAAVRLGCAEEVDLIVLDLMLPGLDGMEAFRRIRHRRGSVPVVMLTARGDEPDRILGLEVGADDYVTKPFSARELVLRIRSVLRRGQSPEASNPKALRSGELWVDLVGRRATRSDRELALTNREFDLLAFLITHPGTAYSREELMRRVWGWEFGDSSTVTVHIRRLREKVEPDPARPSLISTVWGVGYRWDDPGASDGA